MCPGSQKGHLCPHEAAILWRAWAGAGSWQEVWPDGEQPMLEQVSWQGLWSHGGPTLEQSVPEGLHPMERTHSEAAHEELQPMGRTHVGVVHGGIFPMGGTPCWSLGGVWRGWSSRDNVWWTDCNPLSLSSCAIVGEQVGKSGLKMSPKRRERWREDIFKIWFHFSLPCSDLIGNKLTYFPQVKSVLPVMVIAEWSLAVFILTHKLCIIIFAPFGVTEWLSVHLTSSQGQPTTSLAFNFETFCFFSLYF